MCVRKEGVVLTFLVICIFSKKRALFPSIMSSVFVNREVTVRFRKVIFLLASLSRVLFHSGNQLFSCVRYMRQRVFRKHLHTVLIRASCSTKLNCTFLVDTSGSGTERFAELGRKPRRTFRRRRRRLNIAATTLPFAGRGRQFENLSRSVSFRHQRIFFYLCNEIRRSHRHRPATVKWAGR